MGRNWVHSQATGKQGPHNQFKKTLGPWAVGQRAAHDIYLGPQPGLAGLETCSIDPLRSIELFATSFHTRPALLTNRHELSNVIPSSPHSPKGVKRCGNMFTCVRPNCNSLPHPVHDTDHRSINCQQRCEYKPSQFIFDQN